MVKKSLKIKLSELEGTGSKEKEYVCVCTRHSYQNVQEIMVFNMKECGELHDDDINLSKFVEG